MVRDQIHWLAQVWKCQLLPFVIVSKLLISHLDKPETAAPPLDPFKHEGRLNGLCGGIGRGCDCQRRQR
jgi:hypothetical protein